MHQQIEKWQLHNNCLYPKLSGTKQMMFILKGY